MKNVSENAGIFFDNYAYEFDDIYRIQTGKGPWGWLNRLLRKSMLIRYHKTFVELQPMKNMTVLDIGCGSGRYLVKCLELGAAEVTGIDLSREMLSITQESLKSRSIPSNEIELIAGDFLEYDFQKCYDYAIVMGVMDYIEQPAEFLAKLSKTVRKTAVLSFPVSESIWTIQRKLRYKLRRCPLYYYRRRKLGELMDYSGFASVTIEQIARDYFVVAKV